MSDTAVTVTPATESQGAEPQDAPVEPTAPAVEATPEAPESGVQPTESTATAQPDGGQGLIAKYLEGVDESIRDTVAERLEQQRQDSDAHFTKSFEELNAFKEYAEDPTALEMPVALYENLMEKPLETIQWVLERFQTEAGLDLKAQLLQALSGEGEPPAPDPNADPTEDPNDKPLTIAEWQRLQQEQEAARQAEKDNAQRRETVKTWFEEATKANGLEVGDEDVAIKQAILTHAAQLVQRPEFARLGEQAGKQALTTAVEAFVTRFGKPSSAPAGDPPTPEPTVANGGTPPVPQEADLSDPAARKAYMRQFLERAQASQE